MSIEVEKVRWETIFCAIYEEETHITDRLKVPGGWLVKISEDRLIMHEEFVGSPKLLSLSTSITFYPDPNHEWEIE